MIPKAGLLLEFCHINTHNQTQHFGHIVAFNCYIHPLVLVLGHSLIGSGINHLMIFFTLMPITVIVLYNTEILYIYFVCDNFRISRNTVIYKMFVLNIIVPGIEFFVLALYWYYFWMGGISYQPCCIKRSFTCMGVGQSWAAKL